MRGEIGCHWRSLWAASVDGTQTFSSRSTPHRATFLKMLDGDYSLMSFSTSGWTWTNTGTESSTLHETVGQTVQSMPDMMTGAAEWHRLARFGAYLCASDTRGAPEITFRARTSSGYAALTPALIPQRRPYRKSRRQWGEGVEASCRFF